MKNLAQLQRITEVLQSDVDAGLIAGAVTWVARDDTLAYFQAVGFAERAGGRPLQLDSLFRIASMTKPITVLAAMMLKEQGKLRLADPVSRFLPELRDLQVGVEVRDAATGIKRLQLEPARGEISILDLMRHTAGLTYGEFGDSLIQRQYRAARMLDPFQSNHELVAKIAKLPLASQPGSTFEYGMSTDVLGRVVEVAAGMSLDRFFSEYILQPLGMHDTTFVMSPDQKRRLALPQGRLNVAAAPPPAQPRETRTTRWISGGGGLLSTAADYARFCRMMLDGGVLDGIRLVSRDTIEHMTRNQLPEGLRWGPQSAELGLVAPLPELGQGYGLGLGVRLASGEYYWSGITGSYFWVDPAERLITVFMLAELDMQRRARYPPLLRELVYGALR